MGPTASGKTDLAVNLVQTFPFEIISVDSGMIYRGMDIGTAKPDVDQLAIAQHRLINICDPSASYSAAQFREDALKEIDSIFAIEKTPLLVGGTMLYFKVLQQGISPLPGCDVAVRAKITEDANKYGWQYLHERLQSIDPVSAFKISIADTQRIQRALEIYEITGKSISELCALNPPQPIPYKVVNIALLPKDRDWLRERIALRLKLMLQHGFVEEVESLYKRGDLHPDLPAMRAVGYRQVWSYLAGEINYNEMQEQIFFATCQLAKRQLTWLKSWENVNYFDCDDKDLLAKVRLWILHNN